MAAPMLTQLFALTLTWTQPVEHLRQPEAATFTAAAGRVSNWREGAVATLLLPARLGHILTIDLMAGVPPSQRLAVARCVRLNNYWCIKGKAWAGELGQDQDGHAAFATPLDGAIAAARLLRRYYINFHRKTALDIVGHWAPASCFAGVELVVPHADAPHGIGGTLRARWLASHHRATLHRFFAPLQRKVVKAGKPAPLCSAGSVRVQAYAAAAGAHIALGKQQDLGLFLADGTPTPHLAQMLANMAGVEIGPQKVGARLVAAALAGLGPLKTPRAEPQ